VATPARAPLRRPAGAERARHDPGVTLAAAALALALAGPPAEPGTAAQAVTVHLALVGRPHGSKEERVRIRDLEYELMGHLQQRKAGVLERDEWKDGVCLLHLAGPDARAVWAAVEAPVRAFRPRPGSFAVLRLGGRGAAEERIPLDAPVAGPGPPASTPRP
jgi:hypothetical protein